MPISEGNAPLIAATIVFVCIMLLAWAWLLFTRYQARRQALIHKIQHSGHFAAGDSLSPAGTSAGFGRKILSLLGQLGTRVARTKVMDPMDSRIRFLQAGLRGEKAPAVFWGIKVILALLTPLLFLLANTFVPMLVLPPAQMVLALSLPALIGFYLPDLWLYNRGLHRKEDILNGFPDALDLLVVCVEAGMGLDAAISRVAREIEVENPTLSDELTLFSLEMRAGLLRRDALKNLSMRTDLVEVNRLTTLLIQTDRFGTSVGNALKIFSDTLRTQRYQRAEELAGKIPVKLLFPMILFIFPALFVVILGPAAIQIYKNIILR
ncbi:MAG: type II secretion system F family protein [Desulfatirhabdiaceae bacterium]